MIDAFTNIEPGLQPPVGMRSTRWRRSLRRKSLMGIREPGCPRRAGYLWMTGARARAAVVTGDGD